MKRSDAVPRAFARGFLRALPAFVLSAALLFALLSCGKEKIEPADEGEAIAAAERLIGEAGPWIRLFYTAGGMPLVENGRTQGVYREVDGDEMEKLGFRRLSDIRDYEKRIFTAEMCEAQDAVLFSGGGWNAALIEYTAPDETGKPAFVCFLADPNELPYLPNDEAVFDFSAATVTSNRGDRVKIEVPVTGTGASAGKTATKTLDLRRSDGAWYLDNYPNVVFPKAGN